MIGDKSQRTVNTFRSKVHGHALPYEQRFAPFVKGLLSFDAMSERNQIIHRVTL